MENSKRIHWLDLARSIAIICVVFCHAIDHNFQFNMEYMSMISMKMRIFAFLGLTLGRLGVPLFLFISGYLLLGRCYNTESCLHFWRKNFLCLFVTTELWILLYNLFLMYFYHTQFSIKTYILNVFFLKNVSLSHMWYMQMILGIYLFLPFLSNLVQMFNEKILYIILGVLIFYGFFASDLNILCIAVWKERLDIRVPEFLGGVYGVYLILGYLVKKEIFNNIKKRYMIIVCVMAYLGAVWQQLYCYSKGVEYNILYNNFCLLLYSFMIFLLIKCSLKTFYFQGVETLAKFAFGIYLIHNPIMIVFTKYYLADNIYFKVLVSFSVALIGSYLIILFVSKMGKIGKYLFMIK